MSIEKESIRGFSVKGYKRRAVGEFTAFKTCNTPDGVEHVIFDNATGMRFCNIYKVDGGWRGYTETTKTMATAIQDYAERTAEYIQQYK